MESVNRYISRLFQVRRKLLPPAPAYCLLPPAPASCPFPLSLGGCLDIYVDLLSAPTSEYPIPVNKEKYEDYDHENRDNRDYAGTATTPTTIIVVSHGAAPLYKVATKCSGDQISEGDLAQLLPHATWPVNHDVAEKRFVQHKKKETGA